MIDNSTTWKIVLSLAMVLGIFSPTAQVKATPDTTVPYALSHKMGNQTMITLMSDGTVMAFGNNDKGQLGNGTLDAEEEYPARVLISEDTPLTNIKEIAINKDFVLALDDKGVVWSWGNNSYGQLGANIEDDYSVYAISVYGLQNIQAISAGYEHGLALDSAGHVWAWGSNDSAQLGTLEGDWDDQYMPVQVTTNPSSGSLSNIQAIAAGKYYSLALDEGGQIWGWGQNQQGQLGFGSSQFVPANPNQRVTNDAFNAFVNDQDDDERYVRQARPVSGSNEVFTSISAGVDQSLAIKEDGSVYAWGFVYDDLVNEGLFFQGEALQLNDATTAATITAGKPNYIGLKDGSTWCFGEYCPSERTVYQPIKIDELSGMQSISSSQMGESENFTPIVSTGITKDARIWKWQSSVQTKYFSQDRYITGPKLTSVTDSEYVATGLNNSYFLKDGAVLAWGANSIGQAGIGRTSSISSGITVVKEDGSPLSGISQISSSGDHTLAVEAESGQVWAWGANSNGQLGNGTTQYSITYAVPVETNDGPLMDVESVSAGYDFSLALKRDGTVWSWGKNGLSQLGDGGYTDRNYAGQVITSGSLPLTEVTAIAAGNSHSLVLQADGTVLGWGNAGSGSLLSNSGTVRNAVDLQLDNTVHKTTAIAAGSSFSVILKDNGTVWSWGSNNYGQLGTGSLSYSTYTPGQVITEEDEDLTDIVAISAGVGYGHALALDSNHQVWSWGNNGQGQLGLGDLVNRNSAHLVVAEGFSNTVGIATGSNHTMAMQADGSAWSWGLENGDKLALLVPILPLELEEMFPALFPSINTDLTDLQVDGETVTGFNMDNTGPYVIEVPHGTLNMEVTYTTSNPQAVVVITGAESLVVGNNNISVEVIDPLGATKIYQITIVRAGDGTTETGGNGNGSGNTIATAPLQTTNGIVTIPSGMAGQTRLRDEVVINIPTGATNQTMNLTVEKLLNTTELVKNGEQLASPVFELLKSFTENFQKPITLTFKFDTTKIQSNQHASLFYYDEVNKVWVKVESSVEGNVLTAEVDHFTKYAVLAVDDTPATTPIPSFTDISGHWAEEVIKAAAEQGVTQGYLDGTFQPEGTITRAEFVVMLMNALKQEIAGATVSFRDAIAPWAQQSIAQASALKIVDGYDDGTFRPDTRITRAELAVMIARANGTDLSGSDSSTFTDDDQVPVWARNAVAALQEQGLVSGRGGHLFAPNDTTTRAEALQIIMNLLKSR